MQIEVLGERYQLQDPIGRGGMATIYRGRDLRMDRVVAIKVLREVYSTDPKFVQRFQREAKAASSLQHPNIVQVYDYGQTDGNYFIVMELVEGTDLRRYLRSRGLLAVDRAIIIAHDVALGLGAAHRRGIVHRDVKPQNILVGRDGSIKLTDFGIASVYKDINAERLTTTGMTLGTVQYYAPEQAQGEIVSPAADVYALGIVMYEMLTGRTPFDGDTPVAVAMQHIQDPPVPPSQLNPNIPPALEEIILRCLEKIPEMRFRDGSSLARALEALGETAIGESIASSSNNVQIPPASPIYNQIPPRPNSGRSETSGPPVSSPNNGIEGIAANDADNLTNGVGHPSDQPLPLNQQGYSPPSETGTTRPNQFEFVGTRPRSSVVQEQRDSRFASIITVLILLATLLLLGFSIYLAAQLGFLNLPPITPASPTATADDIEVDVPDLTNMDLQTAQKTAQARGGFIVVVDSGPTDGVVKNQSPKPPAKAQRGTQITVVMGAKPPPSTIVPDNLVGNTLATAEAILRNAGIQYKVVNDGIDKTKPDNSVVRTDPASGQPIAKGAVVTLYVVNLANGPPTTSPGPTATPTTAPSPTPTTAPSPTPTTAPSPTPTTAPSPTPTTGPSPTPTH